MENNVAPITKSINETATNETSETTKDIILDISKAVSDTRHEVDWKIPASNEPYEHRVMKVGEKIIFKFQYPIHGVNMVEDFSASSFPCTDGNDILFSDNNGTQTFSCLDIKAILCI